MVNQITTTINLPTTPAKLPIRIPIMEDLLNVFKITEQGTLRRISDTEYYLFSEKQWYLFKEEQQATLSPSLRYFESTREGRMFMRYFYDNAGTIVIEKKHIIIPPFTREKLINEKK